MPSRKHKERQARCAFLCKVPSSLKFPTFRQATALQRKLSFGALDFSPLRHVPLSRNGYIIPKSVLDEAIKFWQNHGKSAAQESGTPTVGI